MDEREEAQGEGIICESPEMRQVIKIAYKVADTPYSVLIMGETGVGKEPIARFIHSRSSRKDKIFATVDCGAVAAPIGSLLQDELFGHEKGAFNGATSPKPGAFETAKGGTIFLDEIGNMDLKGQRMLLRVLQTGFIKRLGGTKDIQVNVRVISATNTDLTHAIKAGTFREDLFYRLAQFPIYILPLHQRVQDISQLATHFINKFSKKNEKTVKGIQPEALRYLERHTWAGNVRELENAIRTAMVLAAENPVIELKDILYYFNTMSPSLEVDRGAETGTDAIDNILNTQKVTVEKIEDCYELKYKDIGKLLYTINAMITKRIEDASGTSLDDMGKEERERLGFASRGQLHNFATKCWDLFFKGCREIDTTVFERIDRTDSGKPKRTITNFILICRRLWKQEQKETQEQGEISNAIANESANNLPGF